MLTGLPPPLHTRFGPIHFALFSLPLVVPMAVANRSGGSAGWIRWQPETIALVPASHAGGVAAAPAKPT